MINFVVESKDNFFDTAYFKFVYIAVGGIIGFGFKAWLVGYQIRKQEHGNARTKLRTAFTPVRRELQEISSNDSTATIITILEKHHNSVRETMIGFEDTILSIKKWRLRKIWFKYCETDYRNINKPIRYYHHSFKKPGENKATIEMRDAVLETIKKLLKFAK